MVSTKPYSSGMVQRIGELMAGGVIKNLRILNVCIMLIVIISFPILIDKKQNYSELHRRVSDTERRISKLEYYSKTYQQNLPPIGFEK